MNVDSGLKQVRAMVSLMIVLIVFLAVAMSLSIARQKDSLMKMNGNNARRELELIGTLSREALMKRDYATVEQFFSRWGADNGDVMKIEATSPNGFVLASYEADGEAGDPVDISLDVRSAGRTLLSISMRKDLGHVGGIMENLLLQHLAGLVIFTVAMGVALWYTLRRTAIVPMEKLVQEKNRLNRELEKRVQDRTADLVASNTDLEEEIRDRLKAEEELRRQNLELKKLDEMKDALIRDISHELKTPVAKHFMQLEILRNVLAKVGRLEDVDDILDVMIKSIRRQEHTIRNILFMSRLEQGGRELNLAPFRLDQLIDEVVHDYVHAIASYGITLDLDLVPLSAVSDRELLWHVFSNLLSNSIKYRAKTGPALRIKLEQSNGQAQACFIDNGLGLSETEREKAFERFYQATVSTEGIGLGLNIAKTIVERSGGSIRIDSEGRSKGTAVCVKLPLPESHDGEEPAS